MRKAFIAASLLALMGTGAAHAQGTVKIGVILPYSGQFADTATQIDNGIKLYMKQHGDKAGGMTVEIMATSIAVADMVRMRMP